MGQAWKSVGNSNPTCTHTEIWWVYVYWFTRAARFENCKVFFVCMACSIQYITTPVSNPKVEVPLFSGTTVSVAVPFFSGSSIVFHMCWCARLDSPLEVYVSLRTELLLHSSLILTVSIHVLVLMICLKWWCYRNTVGHMLYTALLWTDRLIILSH